MSVMQNHFNVDNKNELDTIRVGHMVQLQEHSRDELYNMLYDSLNFDVKSINKNEISGSLHPSAKENCKRFSSGYQKKAACTSKRPYELDAQAIEHVPGIVVKKSLKSTSINDPDQFGKIQEPVDSVSLIPLINSNNNSWQLSKFSLVHSTRKKWDDRNKTNAFLSSMDTTPENNDHQQPVAREKTSEDGSSKEKNKKKKNYFLKNLLKMKKSKAKESKIFDF